MSRDPRKSPMAGDVLHHDGATIVPHFVNADGVVCFNRYGSKEGRYCYGLGDWRALVETASVVKVEESA
jgi:hypothetical protein